MKQIESKSRRKCRSPGRKEKRRRTASVLAAAGAIAGGTQAYAVPFRFDNPAHGEAGHFHWVGTIGEYVWLDVTVPSEDQKGWFPIGKVGQRVSAGGQSNLASFPGSRQVGTVFPDSYLHVGVPSGELIPTDGKAWEHYPTYTLYPAWDPETLLPEGQATYLGIRFDLGAGDQYGWIGVVRNGAELEAFAWAYERDPGVPIEAGTISAGACCGPGPCQEIFEVDCEAKGWKYFGDAITCEEAACNNIPTVSEWGLAIMALSLLAAGTWVVRQRAPCSKPPVA